MFMQVLDNPNVPPRDHEIASRIAARLARVPCTDRPYPHFVADQLLDPDFTEALLQWLEQKGRWEDDNQSWYRFEKCLNLKEILDDEAVAPLLRRPVMNALWDSYERYFGQKLERDWIFLSVHKMGPGNEITLHTDPVWAQNFRLIVNLFPGYRPHTHGAFFGITDTPDNPVETFLASFHGSAIGFELTESSYHSVTPVLKGSRYSVCFGFYKEGRGPTDIPVDPLVPWHD